MALLLAWPGAIVIGLTLGLVGSGGSILTVPVLVYLLDQPERLAIASSLAIVGAIALFAAIPYARERLIDWRSVLLFGVPGMAGTWLGAAASAFVPGSVQLVVFALVMLLAARFMLQGREAPATSPAPRRATTRIGLDGLAVGALTGFVGVGGGFLVVPALVVLGGLRMQVAVGTSLVIIAMKSAVGFAKYLQVLQAEALTLDTTLILAFITLGVIGSLVGSALATRISQRRLKRGFAYGLLVVGTLILTQSLSAML